MLNERLEYLRNAMLEVRHAPYRVRKPLSILNEDTKTKPVAVRKALAFKLIMEKMPLFILNRELIVGGRTMFAPRRSDFSLHEDGTKKNLDFAPDAETLDVETPGFEFYPHYATEEEKALAREMNIGEGYVTSHCTAGYRKVLRLGFGGIREQAEARLQDVEPGSNQESFLRAVIICMNGATRLVERCEELAHTLMNKESDKTRKRELNDIASICSRVKTKPPQTFREALQMLFFAHTMILIENYNLMALGRMDQYLFPYYRADIDNGVITKEEAGELLACLFIKMNDTSDLHTDNGQNIILSGLTQDGEDGTNDLTYLIIDVFKDVRLTDPQINIRYHEGTPNRLLDQILNFGNLGPVPMIYNDHTAIDAMLNIGVELTDARDYCIDACQDLMIAEKSDFYPIFAGIYGIHLLTILERVVERLSQHTTFDQFWSDLKHEMRVDIASFVEQANCADKILPIISPVPFLSSTLEGCIETGRDKTEGGTIYNFTGFVGGGLVNVANSAAAIRKIIFKEKRLEPDKMVEALKNEYEGLEPLRQSILNDSPKFGNNDDNVDLLAVELANYFCDEVNKCKNPRGGRFVAGFFSHHQARLGKVVHATADGRKQGEPLAVSLSPSNGTERQGPTGAILSAAKIDQRKCPLGTSLDLTFYGPSVHEREEREKIVSLIRSYMDLGGIELQMNLLDPEILRDAQKNPDRYRDLVVRVWGFNAYFVSLKPEYQEEIISRIERK